MKNLVEPQIGGSITFIKGTKKLHRNNHNQRIERHLEPKL